MPLCGGKLPYKGTTGQVLHDISRGHAAMTAFMYIICFIDSLIR